jgi:hypothetical protein
MDEQNAISKVWRMWLWLIFPFLEPPIGYTQPNQRKEHVGECPVSAQGIAY